MVGLITHQFSATQAEQLSNSAGVATTWVGPNEWNSAHTATVTLAGNTLGVSTVVGTNIMLGASGGLSVSGAAGSIFVQGVQLSAFVPGNQGGYAGSALTAMGATTSIFGNVFTLPVELVADHYNFYLSNPTQMIGASFASSSTTHTGTTTGATTVNAGLWSRQGGTSTGTLTLITSGQVALSASMSQSGTSQSNSQTMTLSWTYGFPTSSATATFSGTTNVQNTGVPLSSAASFNSWTNVLFNLPQGMTTTLEPGEYFFGACVSTAGANALASLAMVLAKVPLAAVNLGGLLGSVNTTLSAPFAIYAQGAVMSGMSANALPAAFTITNMKMNSVGFPAMEIVNYVTSTAIYP